MTLRPRTKLALFDCDGTLSDGQAAVCAAMEEAFAEAGRAAPPGAAIRRIVGLSLPQAIRALDPEAPVATQAAIVEAYRQAFFRAREEGRVAEPLYAGIADLLRALRAQGWTLGVATGKSARGLTGCLVTHGVFDLFATLQTADRHPSKPHPSMLEAAMTEAGATAADTVMIGDTAYDMAMAQAAGVRAIGVAWGYHRADELLVAGAEAVAQTPAELGELLDG
jgi:phosphoglycolate phosphatase